MTDDQLSITIEDLEDDHYCPVCGELFDRDEWTDEGGHFYPRSGGMNSYGCPVDGCTGLIDVHI